jgi:TIR domain-containing protein
MRCQKRIRAEKMPFTKAWLVTWRCEGEEEPGLYLSYKARQRAKYSLRYKREDQATARKLANALESQGWSVWWDPKLRAGERFNDAIEKALKESKAVVVMCPSVPWSRHT